MRHRLAPLLSRYITQPCHLKSSLSLSQIPSRSRQRKGEEEIDLGDLEGGGGEKDGGPRRRRQDHHPLQAQARRDRHHHPHHRNLD